MHGAPMHGARERRVGPGVSDDGVVGVVAVLGHVRARRQVPNAAAAGAGRPPAGLLREGRAHAAAPVPGVRRLHA